MHSGFTFGFIQSVEDFEMQLGLVRALVLGAGICRLVLNDVRLGLNPRSTEPWRGATSIVQVSGAVPLEALIWGFL